MTLQQKAIAEKQLKTLKVLTEEEDEDLLSVMLERAKYVILSRRFPYGDYPTRETPVLDEDGNVTFDEDGAPVTETETYVETRYLDLQVRIAQAMYNRIGMEGEISHSTNGTSRSFSTDGVPLSLLREIVPMGSAVR